MCLETSELGLSPGRYQLLEELGKRGFDTYICLPEGLKNRRNFNSIHHVVNVQGMSAKEMQRKIVSINPEVVIATMYLDMHAVYKLPYLMKNTSFYYYNLEIYTPYVNNEVKKENAAFYFKYKLTYPFIKTMEIVYTRKIKAFTIQDSIRRKLSAKYHIQHRNTFLVPNSYIFDEAQVISDVHDGVIYTGGIKRDFLLEQFDDLKKVKKVALTFSGYIDSWCKKKIKKLRLTNPNLEFKEQVLSNDEHTNFMRQYAVGLVWYSPLKEDEARYYIGLSSGKMFKHLSLGQPIIIVRCEGAADVVAKYKIGIVIDNISELDDAYNEILKNYSYYRNNVLKVYKNKFDFKKVIAPFLDCIERNI